MGAPLSLRLLRLYPKRAGSALVARLVALPVKRAWRKALLGRFASSVGADLSEADRPLEEYATFLDFFTRRLKPGARPQAPLAPGALNSPVDAAIVSEGRVDAGSLLQAKGLPYTLAELMGNDPLVADLHGSYVTLYLAPKDYHRIHVPLEGECVAVGRIEGELWPVNAASTAHTSRLYVRNRRAWWVARGRGADAGLTVAVVMVAATHVGGVVIDERWLSGRAMPRTGRLDVASLPCAPGDDLGVFELGSTVVMIVGGPRGEEWRAQKRSGDVRVGERLGAFP